MCGGRDKAHKGVLTAGKQNCLITHLKKRNNNNSSSNNTKTETDCTTCKVPSPPNNYSSILFFARSRRSHDGLTLAGLRSLAVLQHVIVASSLSDFPSTN